MSQVNLRPGEFVIEAMTLVTPEGDSIALENIVTSFRLYESIFNKFVSADISLRDGTNVLKNYKIVGQEYIRISVRGKEGTEEKSDKKFSIDKTFRVYKAVNNVRLDDKTQTVQLKLCEPRLLYVSKRRMSKTFRGSYSSMVLSSMKEFGNMKDSEVDFWESTLPENVQFICPNWTVNHFLDYCINNADRGVKAAWRRGFFFFQTLNGGFRFMSIDEMFEREFPLKFNYYPKSASLESLDLPINSEGGLNSTIEEYNKPQLFNILRGTEIGAFSASLRVYNPIKKIEEEHHYDLAKTMKRGTHLSGFPMLRLDDEEVILQPDIQNDPLVAPPSTSLDADFAPNKAYNSVVVEDFTMMHPYGDADDIELPEIFSGNSVSDEARLERNALLEILQQNVMVLKVPFRTDITVGTVIVLNIPEAEVKKEDNDIKNTLNDNRYLITDIMFEGFPEQRQGEVTIECVKESFSEDVKSSRPLDNVGAGEII